MDRALTPSSRRDRALASGVAALLLLGAHHAADEYRPAFALWAIGRAAPWSWAPSAALFALQLLAIAMLVGRATRAFAGVACAVSAGLYATVPATYHNNHYLLFLLLLLVALAPTNGTSRVDLARAVRWQLSLVYLASVVVKLAHPWWRGSGAIIRWLATTRAPEANPDALTSQLFARLLSGRIPSRLAEVAVTVIEVALPLGLASPRTRRLAIGTGVLLHISMQEWLFPQLFTFLMLLGYFAWSPADDRAWKLTFPEGAATRPRLVAALDALARVDVRVDPSTAVTTLVDPRARTFRGGWVLLPLACLSPHVVTAYAAIALVIPELRSLGPLSRDPAENALVAVVLLAYLGSILSTRDLRLPGGNSSQPD